ncbi:FixH family protein [Shewanella gelidii]|uniref:Cytochrome C oxidase Cbb3 n=1 Tax=Shewanella gelidii TaxID=1642821 RepID=A0A917JWC3_9GAMM|nr:FixH family protein [Shewanella gelidii]MCL1098099.1 FixH family protein [Shewanella gelidii]GGI90467.1 hypothetical protein GCM10009332_29750 [Shewanella gelidii]
MSEQKSWYKQFWPWFLIILPLCAVVASLTTLKIALDNSDSLVAEEYYKDGKKINKDLAKVNYAKQIGMAFLVKFSDQKITIEQHGGPDYLAGLNVRFYHPTLADKDFQTLATADAKRVYNVALEQPLKGDWEVRLESYDNKWRLHKRITVVQGQDYWLN